MPSMRRGLETERRPPRQSPTLLRAEPLHHRRSVGPYGHDADVQDRPVRRHPAQGPGPPHGPALFRVRLHHARQPEDQATFVCKNPDCGWSGSADHDAARNVLHLYRMGLALLPVAGRQSSGARSTSNPLPQGKRESPGFSWESTSMEVKGPPGLTSTSPARTDRSGSALNAGSPGPPTGDRGLSCRGRRRRSRTRP
jgi:hypothetical protein